MSTTCSMKCWKLASCVCYWEHRWHQSIVRVTLSTRPHKCRRLGYKAKQIDSQHHRGMRRRCLVFEVSGVSGKNSKNNSTFQPSVSLPSTGKFTSEDRQLTLLRPGSSLSSRMLPGIGLHLNTFATISRNRMVTPETLFW
ncbi:protein tesmin/TSO1-like CXC 2 [Iris pallida]|uniref:Protein tesmin/TSO1-like CXC 2 n=1 Tax=Iris pallida TaxID=29817 RepID=A0AAX6DY81_IRIPA|nr:protein tesmin/TSO1-like CXC 2 [Iris pallida]